MDALAHQLVDFPNHGIILEQSYLLGDYILIVSHGRSRLGLLGGIERTFPAVSSINGCITSKGTP